MASVADTELGHALTDLQNLTRTFYPETAVNPQLREACRNWVTSDMDNAYAALMISRDQG